MTETKTPRRRSRYSNEGVSGYGAFPTNYAFLPMGNYYEGREQKQGSSYSTIALKKRLDKYREQNSMTLRQCAEKFGVPLEAIRLLNKRTSCEAIAEHLSAILEHI